MVFEYAELDLEIVIQSPVVRTIDEPRAASIVQQIARGRALHAREPGHAPRFGPSNCLITRKGAARALRLWISEADARDAYTLPRCYIKLRPPERARLPTLRTAH